MKTKLLLICSSFLAVIAPVKPLIYVAILAILIDTCFGIWSSDQSANASAIGGTIPTDLSTYNPISWWRCGDGDTAPTLTDNGSGGNDGTMTNFTTFSTDVPT
jgi:hypothetical protein